jgi:hypothetical protein
VEFTEVVQELLGGFGDLVFSGLGCGGHAVPPQAAR